MLTQQVYTDQLHLSIDFSPFLQFFHSAYKIRRYFTRWKSLPGMQHHYTQYIKHCQEVEYVIMTKTTLGVTALISYDPFYRTLLRKNITEYHLIFKQGISANTLHRMKHGKPVTTKTLDELCFILDCDLHDIIEYKKEEFPE